MPENAVRSQRLRRSFGDLAVALVLSSAALQACSSSSDVTNVHAGEALETVRAGSLEMAVTLVEARRDVEGFLFTVHPEGADCDSAPVEQLGPVALEEGGLPNRFHDPSVQDGVGDDHPFADGFFVLDPGTYTVCATPVDGAGAPSEFCGVATTEVEVFAGETTEVNPALVSECTVEASGATDIIATLNSAPQITTLEIDPGKFINTCETIELTPQAVDAEDDEITFTWEVIDGPAGSDPELTAEGVPATFTTDDAGDYELRLTATDVYGASTSLDFPVHVEPGGSCEAFGADLLPVTKDRPDAPGVFAFCDRDSSGATPKLVIRIRNAGSVDAIESETLVRFLNGVGEEIVGVELETPPVAAGEQVILRTPLPEECDVGGGGCSFAIEADSAEALPESNETNNLVAGACF